MKNLLTILMLCGVCCAYAQNTPPHAASTRTWSVGIQTWSDAIHIPDCNKMNEMNSLTVPQCRSYTEGANTWYYYNWPYVIANADLLCPIPWHVPTSSDLDILRRGKYTALELAITWGLNGYMSNDKLWGRGRIDTFWSATPLKGYSTNVKFEAECFFAVPIEHGFRYECSKGDGLIVRCVK
jgi:hypothetical protein